MKKEQFQPIRKSIRPATLHYSVDLPLPRLGPPTIPPRSPAGGIVFNGLAVDQAQACPERATAAEICGSAAARRRHRARHQTEAVVLDLVQPAGAARGTLGRGWQAGWDEAGRRPAGTQQHANLMWGGRSDVQSG